MKNKNNLNGLFIHLFALGITIIFSAFSLHADEISLKNSKLTDLTIYRTQATVTRTIDFNYTAGETTFVIEGLSSSLVPNSIEINGKGDYVILSVSPQLNYMEPVVKSRQQLMLEDSLDILKRELDKLSNRKSSYNDEISLMNSNKNIGGANTGVKADDLQKMADLFRVRMFEIREKVSEIVLREKTLNESLTRINKQIGESRKEEQPTTRIFVNALSKTSGAGQIEVSYLVNNAGWEPLYNLRSAGTSSKIKLEMRAQVYQQTGEKWDKINLKLSTGMPNLSAVKPILTPWIISFARPVPKTRSLSMQEMKASPRKDAGNMEMSNDMSQVMSAESTINYTVANAQTLATEFEVKLPYTIPSDGKRLTIEIQNNELPAEYSYSVVPKLEKDVFLSAAVTGWEDMNLVPGKLSIYFEGSFVGESYIDPSVAQDTLNISLGRDKKVIVTRKLIKENSGNQFLGTNRVIDRKYEILVKNTRKEKIDLMIEDQIPVSRIKEIEVKEGEMSGGDLNADTGIVTWKIKVNGGESAKKAFSYSVKYPKDKLVYGL